MAFKDYLGFRLWRFKRYFNDQDEVKDSSNNNHNYPVKMNRRLYGYVDQTSNRKIPYYQQNKENEADQ